MQSPLPDRRSDRMTKTSLFRRPLFWILLIVIVLLVASGAVRTSTGPAEGVSFSGLSTTQPSSHGLRIGAFNIDGGHGTDDILDLDRTARCLPQLDFIGLEEVHGQLFGEPRNQAKALAAKLRLAYLWAPAERRWWHESFGNADFTDLPVKQWHRIVLPSAPFHALRNYVLTDVDWHGTTVRFVTTHVDFKNGGDEQLQMVSDVFLNLPEPAVFMGDLNHTIRHRLIKNLLDHPGVQEAISSFLGPTPPGRVDWIFVRGLKTVDAGIVDIGASDHPAYWAEVTLRE